jgi:dienelactone hydrolase
MEFPLQRNPDQGIRLAKYDESIGNPPFGLNGKPPIPPDVSANVYAEYEEMFRYSVGTIDADSAELITETEEDDWIRRKILIPTDNPADPMPVLVFTPKEYSEPLQPVVFFPPGAGNTNGIPSDSINIARYNIDFIVKSGRALVWPVLIGTYERSRPRLDRDSGSFMRRWHRANRSRRNETGRLLDYLQSDPDFAGDKIALLAASFGATFITPHILATEPRFKSAVLMSASLAGVNPEKVPDHVNPNTYWPNVRAPILVLNGRYDIMLPYGPNSDALISLIGTSDNDKNSIHYESSHWPLPAHRVRNDTLAWFDRYLGPPSSSPDAKSQRNLSD